MVHSSLEDECFRSYPGVRYRKLNVLLGANGFYFVDEHFSCVGSDVEIGCLALMVGYLGDGDQLFFTSHNEELLKLNYPHHSFNFMKKTVLEDGRIQIEMLNAGDFEKRNTVNLKNLFDNDYFGVAPDLSSLYCADALKAVLHR